MSATKITKVKFFKCMLSVFRSPEDTDAFLELVKQARDCGPVALKLCQFLDW